MSIVRMDIEPKVLNDAVSKSGRSIEGVNKRFNGAFERWINQERKPTFNQLVELSKYLRIPFGYLLLKTPVTEELPLLDFRTIDSESIQNPSRELVDTIYDMERKQAWLREKLIEEGNDPLYYVGLFKNEKDISHLQIAEEIRAAFSLDKQWYKNANSKQTTFALLRNSFSQFGVLIMQNGIALNNTHRALNLEEFRAFTLVDEYAPLIFLNSLDSNNGKTFSLLHEIVHILLGIDSLYNNDFKYRDKYTSSIEVLCNKVAGEIIVPTDIFIENWNELPESKQNLYEKIESLAQNFKVSKIVVARKALDQNYINVSQYNEIGNLVQEEYEQSMIRKKRQQSGGNPVNNTLSRLDENFMRTLIASTEFGGTQYSEAYRLAGVSRGVFEDVSKHLKGVR